MPTSTFTLPDAIDEMIADVTECMDALSAKCKEPTTGCLGIIRNAFALITLRDIRKKLNEMIDSMSLMTGKD